MAASPGDFQSFLQSAYAGGGQGSFPSGGGGSSSGGGDSDVRFLLTHGGKPKQAGYGQDFWNVGHPHGFVGTTKPKSTTLQDAKTALYRMKRSAVSSIQQKLLAAGYLKANTFVSGIVDEATLDAYTAAGTDAAAYLAAGHKMTLDQLLTKRAGEISEMGGLGGGSGSQAGTTTSTQTQEFTGQQAGATLESAMEQLLGRAPSQDEVAAFRTNLNSEAEDNPQTTTTTTDEEGNSDSVTGGGVDPNAFAESYLSRGKMGKEQGAYQAATTYYNAALQAIGALV